MDKLERLRLVFRKDIPKLNTWLEFKNLKAIAQYEEVDHINRNILTVKLKSDDQHFIRLTNTSSYMGSSIFRIDFLSSNGYWSSQRNKTNIFRRNFLTIF